MQLCVEYMAEHRLIQTELRLHDWTDAADLVTGHAFSSRFPQARDFKLQSVRFSHGQFYCPVLEECARSMPVIVSQLSLRELGDRPQRVSV